jgi:hypothetical protein
MSQWRPVTYASVANCTYASVATCTLCLSGELYPTPQWRIVPYGSVANCTYRKWIRKSRILVLIRRCFADFFQTFWKTCRLYRNLVDECDKLLRNMANHLYRDTVPHPGILSYLITPLRKSQKLVKQGIIHFSWSKLLPVLKKWGGAGCLVRIATRLREKLTSALFWGVTQRRMVIPYQSFFLHFLTLEDGTDMLSRNVGRLISLRCVISQKNTGIIYIA